MRLSDNEKRDAIKFLQEGKPLVNGQTNGRFLYFFIPMCRGGSYNSTMGTRV